MQIPTDGSMLAIDLEGIKGLVAARIAGRLEKSKRSIVKPAQKRTGIVDRNLLHFAGQLVHPLLDKRLGHCRDILDAPIQPHRRIDAMRKEIAKDAGTG